MGDLYSKSAEACAAEPTTAVELAGKEEVTAVGIVVGILWFLMIALMFNAQHTTCDQYFVPAINVFVDKMRNSKNPWMQRWGQDAVAGATICALGCNGPELFSNLISLYTHSDAGIGVVVGSEIFNLLIIIGAATIAAPTLPLELEISSFTRDVFFYGLSIALLTWVLADGWVMFYESMILLGAAVLYVSAVYFTEDIEKCLVKSDGPKKITSKKSTGMMHGIEVTIEECFHAAMADAHHYKPDLSGTESSGKEGKKKKRNSLAFQFSGAEEKTAPMLDKHADHVKYEFLKEVIVHSEGLVELQFYPRLAGGLVEGSVTLKVKANTIKDRDILLDHIKDESLGRAWIHNYDSTPVGACKHFYHYVTDKDESILNKILAVPELLIECLLKSTLFWCDVKDISKENLWAICWLGAMIWLAIFSWGMLTIANFIHDAIPVIPISFLGITVCAVGTSFPNAVASIIMSSQDKPAAAIANALGSNVQNVFLAMALPWVIYSISLMSGGECMNIEMAVEGITDGVYWMIGTLVLLLIFVMLPQTCTLTKMYGYLLCVVYVIYVAYASGIAFDVFKSPFEKD